MSRSDHHHEHNHEHDHTDRKASTMSINTMRVVSAFSPLDLKRVCEMHETDFAEAYGMEVTVDADRYRGEEYADFHAFLDNGSNILAVAHLDTVVSHQRVCNFVNTAAGPVVHSGALDDRLGAYTILELLPKLGINVDVLLTTGEEQGNSTAQYFDPPEGKEYLWMIEFDRGGTDVVMYQYDDAEMRDLVRDCGAKPADGAFSDISFLDHLEVKGFNWGVGYQDYHSVRGHAYLEDYWMMIGYWLAFHEANAETYLPHENDGTGMGRRGGSSLWSRWADYRELEEIECVEEDCFEMFAPYYTGQERCDDCDFDYHRIRSDEVDDWTEVAPEHDVVEDEGDVVSEDHEVVNQSLLRSMN